MRLTRRGLMLGGVGLLVLASSLLRNLFTVPAPRAVRPAPVAALLASRLDYLSLDAEGVAEFARHLADAEPADLRALTDPATGPDERATLEDEVVVQYLRSTDFFWNGADESRLLRFTGYYDPYSAACANPFARLT